MKKSVIIAILVVILLILGSIILGSGCNEGKCEGITCPQDQVCNPLTGRCIDCEEAMAQAEGEPDLEAAVAATCSPTPEPSCSPTPGDCQRCENGQIVEACTEDQECCDNTAGGQGWSCCDGECCADGYLCCQDGARCNEETLFCVPQCNLPNGDSCPEDNECFNYYCDGDECKKIELDNCNNCQVCKEDTGCEKKSGVPCANNEDCVRPENKHPDCTAPFCTKVSCQCIWNEPLFDGESCENGQGICNNGVCVIL